MRPAQLAPHRLDLELAAEEVLRLLGVESREPRVGLEQLGPGDAQRHLLERARQRRGARVAQLPLRRDRLAQHRRPGRLGQLRRAAVDPGPDLLARRMVAGPRRRHHLGQQDAGREDVGPRVERLAARLLRRHVGRRARHRAPALGGQRLGDAEVHHHDAAGAGEHHVLGLDVAVHQARGVDRLEAGQELRGDLARLVERERAAGEEDLLQRHAVDVLHRHQLAAVELDEIEDAADVGRHDLARHAHLLAQRLERLRLGEQARAQRLERHVDPQLEIERAPHLAHAAAAEE